MFISTYEQKTLEEGSSRVEVLHIDEEEKPKADEDAAVVAARHKKTGHEAERSVEHNPHHGC